MSLALVLFKKYSAMIQDGDLVISPDCLHFNNDDARRIFANSQIFYERLMDYVFDNKEIVRILMLESLKTGNIKIRYSGF